MSKGQNEMAKRVLLSTLNVGDKFTSDIKGGNFIITSKVGDRINIKDLDTGKETFFGSGSYMVEPISEEAPQQTYTFRQPEYMDDPEYGEKSAEEIYTESKKARKSLKEEVIVIHHPWGEEIKDYKAGDPIPAGTKFKIFKTRDQKAIDAWIDSLYESVSSRNHKFKPEELKVGKRVIDKVGGKEIRGKITVNHHDLYKDNPYTQDKKGSTVVTVVTDSGRSYDVDANDNGGEFILEGCKGKKKISEGYTVIFPTGESQKLKTIEDVNKFVNGVLHMKDKNASNVKLTDAMLDKWNKENDIPLVVVKESTKTIKEAFNRSYNFNPGETLILNTDFGDPTVKSKKDHDPKFNETVIFSKRLDNLNALVKNTRNSGHMNSEDPNVGEKVPLNILMKKADYENWKKSLTESTKTIKEAYLLVDTDTNNKPVYFHWGKYTGIDWWDDKKMASRFSTKEQAERWIEKMRQEGALIKDMKIVKESTVPEKYKGKTVKLGSLKPGDMFFFVIPGMYGDYKRVVKVEKSDGIVWWTGAADTRFKHSSDANTEVFPDKSINESRIAKGYENLTAEERAKHLLSHPTSKYMGDLKSENITERAIRKAVKEMLGKPAKDDPQFITDVNEGCGKVQESFLIVGNLPYDDLTHAYISYDNKGVDLHTPEYKKHATRFTSRQEAQKVLDLMKKEGWHTEKFEIVQEEGEAAPTTSTANVANPELPLKLKEGYKLVDASGSSRSFSTIEALEKFIDDDQGLLEFPLKNDFDIEKWNKWQKRDMGTDAMKIVKESVGQKLNITLIRKPQNMKEVEKDMRAGNGDRVRAVVDKSYTLSKSEYEAFVYNFYRHTTYLSGEGGVDPDGTVHVVEIKAPGMKTIYVDPEGYDYARSVGY